MVTTGAISRVKLQSNHHHQQTNIQFFYRPDVLPVAQPTVSKHWREKYHIPWTCLPQAHLGIFQLCLWPLIAPGYLGGGLPCLSSALWCQYPKSWNWQWESVTHKHWQKWQFDFECWYTYVENFCVQQQSTQTAAFTASFT